MRWRAPLAAAAAAVLLVSACGREATQGPLEPKKLKVAVVRAMSFAPLFIAEQEGFYRDQGLDVEFVEFRRSAEALPALQNKNVDAVGGSISASVINAMIRTGAIKVVAGRGEFRGADADCSEWALVVSPQRLEAGEFRRASDLRGKKVSMNPVGESGYITEVYLRRDGLTLDDVAVVDVEDPLLGEALSTGAADVVAVGEPWVTRFVQRGEAGVVARAEDLVPNMQRSVMLFGPSLIEDDPEAGERFIAAYLLGVREYNKGKTDSNVAVMAEQFSLEEDLIRDACWVQSSSTGEINWGSVAEVQRWLRDRDLIDDELSEDEFWTKRFLEGAGELLG